MTWIFINQLVDNEEKLDKMCPDCRDEVTSKNRCTRCGKAIPHYDEVEEFVNPSFNEDEYIEKSKS